MELLYAMLAEMNDNMKSNLEREEANRKTDREVLKEMITLQPRKFSGSVENRSRREEG
jgi:hypothetical protein